MTCAAVLLLPDVASAQSESASTPAPSPVTDAAREQARQHFEAGIRAADATQWQDAIRELQLARDIRATPAVHYNLGIAYRAVGRNRDAIAALREFLRAPGNSGDAARLRQAATYVTELDRTLGTLEFAVQPEGATVSLDGAPPTALGAGIRVDPGRHVVVVEASNHRSASRTVNVAPGGVGRVELNLVPDSTAARIVVTANVPEASIEVDGQRISHGNADEAVMAGRHVIVVRAPGRSTFRREISVIANGVFRVHAELSDQRPIVASPWFWVGATLIAGGLVAGGFALFSTTEPLYEGTLGHVTGAIRVGP